MDSSAGFSKITFEDKHMNVSCLNPSGRNALSWIFVAVMDAGSCRMFSFRVVGLLCHNAHYPLFLCLSLSILRSEIVFEDVVKDSRHAFNEV